MKRVGVIQPNYLPWRGYFHFIRNVDLFLFHDDIQYTKQDWRNRNKIRLKDGSSTWITVPVCAKTNNLIMDVEINYSEKWIRKHLNIIEQNYRKSPYFSQYFPPLSELLGLETRLLSDLNISLTGLICQWLGITTPLVRTSELNCVGTKDEKLINLMNRVGGTHYLSGPAAKAYIVPDLWTKAGIELEYIEYPAYPPYPQIAEPFEPAVSILDLLFMVGPNAPKYIWGV